MQTRRHTPMSTATVQFESRALQKGVTYNAIIPEGDPGPHPVLLLLHGHGDNHTTWLNNTKLGLYARSQSMLIIMPDGGTSFYLNLDEPGSFRKWHSQQYENFIVQDLWKHVQETYHVRPGRWAIGGNSMGGYGAMRLGCKYPAQFASIWAHSGRYFDAVELEEVVPDPTDADVFVTTERLTHTPQHVEITFDCGAEDVLLEDNRRLHTHMQQIGLAHQYIENTGGHNWDYWDKHLPAALAQHTRVFEHERNFNTRPEAW